MMFRSTKPIHSNSAKLEGTLQIGSRTDYKGDPTGKKKERTKAFIECS